MGIDGPLVWREDREPSSRAGNNEDGFSFVFLLFVFVCTLLIAVGFGLTWGEQNHVPWYQDYLDEISATVRLGITHVYINDSYWGELSENCSLSINLILLPRDECSDFHTAQQTAITTAVFSCLGVCVFLLISAGVKFHRFGVFIVSLNYILTLTPGIATLAYIPPGPPSPGWFILSWALSMLYEVISICLVCIE